MSHFVKVSLLLILSITLVLGIACSSQSTMAKKSAGLKALIIDGENNHGAWPMTTVMMKDYLEQTGMFTVDIERKLYTWQGPHNDGDETMGEARRKELIASYPIPSKKKTTIVEEPQVDPNFSPDFSKYDVVISNLGWKASDWPAATKTSFENYMKAGGGLVVIHAANNSWGDWTEYNKMIGLGGWGGRSEKDGPYVFYDENDKLIKDPSVGPCGSHGAQQEYVLTMRTPNHPITKGLPTKWLHAKDELYDRLRGPAENMTILGTAYSDVEKNGPPWAKDKKGTGRHEPMLFTVDYGKGRVFHNALGHTDYSMECVGFITILQRSCEWAATGNVTQQAPSDFPTASTSMSRSWKN